MEVLEFLDDTGRVMVARVPTDGACEIKWGAQLTVRESQVAAFFRDGRSLVIFKPGRYVLKTQNIPVLAKLVTFFGYGPTSPFRSEVYFLNMKLFRNLKWGTPEPIIFRDPELQMIRLRSFGIFSLQIKNPSVFLNRMVGTQGVFTDENIHDYLKSIVAARIVNVFADHIKTIFDMPKQYDALAVAAKGALSEDFLAAGLDLVDFYINSISLPEEVQKVIDERTQMQAIGNMNTYVQFKTAKAIQEAAQQPGGAAGTGVGLGAGVGMGMMIPGIVHEAFQSAGLTSPQSTSAGQQDPFEKMEKLKRLLDAEAITQAEFDAKKAEIMQQI
jgi:membrane protease subunit (stomatin/prohibitin family)